MQMFWVGELESEFSNKKKLANIISDQYHHPWKIAIFWKITSDIDRRDIIITSTWKKLFSCVPVYIKYVNNYRYSEI